jgi:predicted nucleic acid-binding protein
LILYAESSAVLCWLFEESAADSVRDSLKAADAVLTSALTVVECDRAVIRATALGHLDDREARRVATLFEETLANWSVLEIDTRVWERARRPLPDEPLRTLDALHLSVLLAACATIPDLTLLSLDERLRRSATRAGIRVAPADEGVVAEVLARYQHG